MFHIALLLCLAAAPAFGIWEKGYTVHFGLNPLNVGSTTFMPMPKNITEASAKGWSKVTHALRDEYAALQMWCAENDYTLCILFDDTGYVAGSQIAINPDNFEGALFDWIEAGFTKWTTTVDGVETTFYAIRQFYISADKLATDSAVRIASRDSDYLLQEAYFYVEGFNGELIAIPTSAAELKNSTRFTKQGCMIGMGNHYYYDMTADLECLVSTLLSWFVLEYNDQVIGLGFEWPGKYTIADDKLKPFEEPARLAIEVIVPRGPECLYAMGDSPGMTTMHTYYVKDAHLITCLW